MIPVDINTSTIHFEDQRAILAVIRDITERKALEETRREFAEAQARNAREIEAKNRALTESEARYRQLTEGSLDAIVVADRRGADHPVQPRRRADLRLHGRRGARPAPDHADARGAPRVPRPGLRAATSRPASPASSARPSSCRAAGRRARIPAGVVAQRRRSGRRAAVHRLDPRPDRAAADARHAGAVGEAGLDRPAQRGRGPRDQQPAGLHRQQPGRARARHEGRPGDDRSLRVGARGPGRRRAGRAPGGRGR